MSILYISWLFPQPWQNVASMLIPVHPNAKWFTCCMSCLNRGHHHRQEIFVPQTSREWTKNSSIMSFSFNWSMPSALTPCGGKSFHSVMILVTETCGLVCWLCLLTGDLKNTFPVVLKRNDPNPVLLSFRFLPIVAFWGLVLEVRGSRLSHSYCLRRSWHLLRIPLQRDQITFWRKLELSVFLKGSRTATFFFPKNFLLISYEGTTGCTSSVTLSASFAHHSITNTRTRVASSTAIAHL